MPSERAATALSASGDVDRERIAVIPHGCDHLPEPDVPAANRVLSSLGVRGGYLLTVATLEPRKNLQRLAKAYSSVRAELPQPWPLVVVGPRGWGASLERTDGVVMAGEVDAGALSGLYSSAVLVAYVPLVEGFGLPAVEALAVGAPVLASKGLPSVSELAEGCAVVVDPWSIESIAAGLGELASDAVKRAGVASLGKEAVAGRTWRDSARRHVELWERIAT